MSIPLDRLYHYIESVAQEIRQGNVLIYHFYPHGSKKLEDLIPLQLKLFSTWSSIQIPEIYCYDQEPLNYDYYQSTQPLSDIEYFLKYKTTIPNNIRRFKLNTYDKCLLLHSELNSSQVDIYQSKEFIPVYYWSHALIALDWFRYAQYQPQNKQINKTFLIYNRAWSGTREYRLKFIDLLIENNLISKCQTSCNSIEPDLQIHYSQYQYNNPDWAPRHCLEDHVSETSASSCSSADFDLKDYNSTEFEVVLETLFDDTRIQLTEKILRPIACGQPFLLAGTAGSLKYLHRYGFKTFGEIIDESYDDILDAKERMQSVINTMLTIANWSNTERLENLDAINKITKYNQEYFFSKDFFNIIVDELKQNLSNGLNELEQTNTSSTFLNFRKKISKNDTCRQMLSQNNSNRSRSEIAQIIKKARTYYNRYLKTLNK